MISNEIREKITGVIVGKAMTELKRSFDALWVCFGEKVNVIFADNQTHIRSEYMLRIQCPFRIIQHNTIILGSHDMHVPREGVNEEDFSWEMRDGSLLDALIEKLNHECFPILVEGAEIDFSGSIKIKCHNGMVLEVIINSCLEIVEYWRFISCAEEGFRYIVFEEV